MWLAKLMKNGNPIFILPDLISIHFNLNSENYPHYSYLYCLNSKHNTTYAEEKNT